MNKATIRILLEWFKATNDDRIFMIVFVGLRTFIRIAMAEFKAARTKYLGRREDMGR